MNAKAILAILVIADVLGASVVIFEGFAVQEPGAIRFEASLSGSAVAQGHPLTLVLKDVNTLDLRNKISDFWGPASPDLLLAGCSETFPGTVSVYEGVYGLTNLSSAMPLQSAPQTGFAFYPAGCPSTAVLESGSFTFRPHQALSSIVELEGYYNGTWTDSGEALYAYQPGTYTVVAANSLGNTMVLYFTVTGPTSPQERSGPVSTFPAAWEGSCSPSEGNATTGVYLSLNASAALDNISLGGVYAKMVDSPQFQYATVGHGWVVSQWTEVYSEGLAPGVVEAMFIVTTNGSPTSYLLMLYAPPSGPVTLESMSGWTPSCSG